MAETIAQKLDSSNLGHRMQRFEGFIGGVGPFVRLPQLIKLYFTHSQHAPGQFLLSWSLHAMVSFLWISYGLVSGKFPISVGNGLSMVLNQLMVVGIMFHSGLTF